MVDTITPIRQRIYLCRDCQHQGPARLRLQRDWRWYHWLLSAILFPIGWFIAYGTTGMVRVCAKCGSKRIKGVSYEMLPQQDDPGVAMRARIHRRAMWGLLAGPAGWVLYAGLQFLVISHVASRIDVNAMHFDVNGNLIQQ